MKTFADRRSPLKARPLRNPGQSLDEEINRLVNEKLVESALPAIMFIAVAITEWVHWNAEKRPHPLFYTVLALVAVGYTVFRVISIRRRVRQLKLARDGERAVGQYLESLRARGYRVFHDLLGDGFNIDHVLIGPSGIFTVETKTYHKPAKGPAEIIYDGEQVTIGGYQPDRHPIIQAKAQANWLRETLLESTGKQFEVRSAVLYPGWFIKSPAKPRPDQVWVLNPKALPSFLEHSSITLADTDIHLASSHLSRFIRAAEK